MSDWPPNLCEVLIHGLNKSITPEALTEYLGGTVRIRGILLHPDGTGSFQWAQVWVSTETDVTDLMVLRDPLAANGISLTHKETPAAVSGRSIKSGTSRPLTVSIDRQGIMKMKPAHPIVQPKTGASYHVVPKRLHSLPRNLYVTNLPLDLTQLEFRELFQPFGSVQHTQLLSQLDRVGRRRGFILMSTHREALAILQHMNGRWINCCKIDISWSLVQRETTALHPDSLPNRVVHPPVYGIRRAERNLGPACCVVVDHLDPSMFPDTSAIQGIFQAFGPIRHVTKISDSPAFLIQFENAASAKAVLKDSARHLGNRTPWAHHLSVTSRASLTAVESVGDESLRASTQGKVLPPTPQHSSLQNGSPAANNDISLLSPPFISAPLHLKSSPFAGSSSQRLTNLNDTAQTFIPRTMGSEITDTGRVRSMVSRHAPNQFPPIGSRAGAALCPSHVASGFHTPTSYQSNCRATPPSNDHTP